MLPARALVVAAHPDDIDFGCAGTVARLVAEGCHVAYAVVTSGEAGQAPDDIPRDRVAQLREGEQRAAAAAAGVKADDVHFLGFPDGAVEVTLELRAALTRVMRQTTPDVVICQNPERRWDSVFGSHPDHMAAGEAVIRAVYPDAGSEFSHPQLLDEGLEPHTVREVWIYGTEEPDRIVDMTGYFEAKIAALAAHESQTAHFDLPEFIGGWVKGTAEEHGLPEGRMAEAFRTFRVG